MVATQKRDMPASTQGAPTKSDDTTQNGALKKQLKGMSFEEQSKALSPEQDKKAPKAEAGLSSAPTVAPAAAPSGSFGNPDPANRIAGLHPTFAQYARRVIDIAHGKGLNIFVAQGMRTIAEQNELYKQGRTKKGPVVTWVRGGSSYHNYGLAVDFAFHGKSPYSESHNWKGLVASVREAGLISGASYGDRPHGNLDVPMKSLQAWYKKGGLRGVWDKVSESFGGPRFEPGGDQKADDNKGAGTSSGSGAKGTYTVRSGDTLIEIAESTLGDGSRWHEIAQLNGIKDSRELAIGKVLKLPTGAASKNEEPAEMGGEASFRQRQHTVAPGDTLTKLALKYYGMSSLWQSIATANNIKDPSKLEVGQKLTIPKQGEAAKGASSGAKVVPATHTVASGETLGEIAAEYYGDWARWNDIAKANNIKDPRALKVGQKLTLPKT